MFEFIEEILGHNPEAWSQATGAGAAAFKLRLAAEPAIRIYVGNSENFGNQTSSVLVMKTLIDEYGFSGDDKNVWMVYPEDEAGETRKKLSILIKGFDSSVADVTATYGGVTINFITVEALNGVDPTYGEINYGFAGAGDLEKKDDANWFAINLKTKLFLMLQPYRWDADGPDELQCGDSAQEDFPFSLTEKAGKKDTFSLRGWSILNKYWTPEQGDWDYYSNSASAGVSVDVAYHTKLAKILTDFVTAKGSDKVRFMPSYGIKGVADAVDPEDDPLYYENQMMLPPDQVLPTVVSTALGGSQLDNKVPTIVVSMNNSMDNTSYDSSYSVSRGGLTRTEESTASTLVAAEVTKASAVAAVEAAQAESSPDTVQLQEDLKKANDAVATALANDTKQKEGSETRIAWLDARNAKDGVTFYSSKTRKDKEGAEQPPITTGELTAALNALVGEPANDSAAVLFLELGSLPMVIFNYVMFLGSFPNVFEGANSTNLALNQGKCYLRMKDVVYKDNSPERYPSAWSLGYTQRGDAYAMSMAAADGVTSALLANASTAPNFVENIDLTTGYLNDYYLTPNAELVSYYTEVKDFYYDPLNGKLGIGIAYLNKAANFLNIAIYTSLQESTND